MAYFSDQMIDQVWKKGNPITGYDPAIWRQDFAGAWINRACYGQTETPFGWEIDHLKPVSQGGTDEYTNLFPLQYENNRRKGNDFPLFKTAVTSDGIINVKVEKSWRAN